MRSKLHLPPTHMRSLQTVDFVAKTGVLVGTREQTKQNQSSLQKLCKNRFQDGVVPEHFVPRVVVPQERTPEPQRRSFSISCGEVPSGREQAPKRRPAESPPLLTRRRCRRSQSAEPARGCSSLQQLRRRGCLEPLMPGGSDARARQYRHVPHDCSSAGSDVDPTHRAFDSH